MARANLAFRVLRRSWPDDSLHDSEAWQRPYIKAAIKALPPAERERLAEDLLYILPELSGDSKWQRIVHDPRPRPALTALGDEIEAQFKANPGQFPEIKDGDFDKQS